MERLLCVTHCSRTAYIDHPERCPECGDAIPNFSSFYLPFPFCDGHASPASVLVKPTDSTWNECCAKDLDLHVGVSSFEGGSIYCYHNRGIEVETTGWEEALQVFRLDKCAAFWDATLCEVASDANWTDPSSYDEDHHNCFDFALAFLRRLEERMAVACPGNHRTLICPWLPEAQRDEMKVRFVEKYVTTKLNFAQRHIRLTEQIRASGPCSIAPKETPVSAVIRSFAQVHDF